MNTFFVIRAYPQTMVAINHTATALVLNRRYTSVPLVPLLVSVQARACCRIVYFYRGHAGRVSFATLIRKSDTENLTKAERNHLAELAKMLKRAP